MVKGVIGMALVTVLFVLVLTLSGLVPVFKESLDNIRGASSLNCPGTPGFVQADFDNDTTLEKLNKRPVCFITGISLVWFVLGYIIYAVVWVGRNWGGKV